MTYELCFQVHVTLRLLRLSLMCFNVLYLVRFNLNKPYSYSPLPSTKYMNGSENNHSGANKDVSENMKLTIRNIFHTEL